MRQVLCEDCCDEGEGHRSHFAVGRDGDGDLHVWCIRHEDGFDRGCSYRYRCEACRRAGRPDDDRFALFTVARLDPRQRSCEPTLTRIVCGRCGMLVFQESIGLVLLGNLEQAAQA